MAKDKPKPADPKPASAGKPAAYPRNWGSMNLDERQAWMKEHRPNRPQTVAVKPVTVRAPEPKPVSTPSPTGDGEYRVPVKLKVALWSVQVGDREPVECTPSALGDTITSEQDAYSAEHQEEANRGEEPADEDEE